MLAKVFFALVLCAETATRQGLPPVSKTELNFVPLLGGDSDVGVGVGVVGDLARLRPDLAPFVWRLEAGAFITFKPGEGGDKIQNPYQDYYLELAIPHLPPARRLRLELRPSYTVEATQRFYGVGNAAPRPAGLPDRLSEYERQRAAVVGAVRIDLGHHLFLRSAADYAQIRLNVPPDGLLAEQRRNGPDEVRQLLDGPDRFGVAAGEIDFEYDSRDDEIVTRTGASHHLGLRASPRLGPDHPFQFGEANATLRLYRAPWRWLQLAGRLVGDVLFGDVPFYDLTRIADVSVVGGSRGIRGVPGQRYYGKVKLLGNVEARAEVWHFNWWSKPFILAVAGFVDGGRVWADLKSSPALDGTGLGLHYGVGGGLRLQEGRTFVVRLDVAWSPDADPVGAYFAAGETF
jgi:surface antigen Omp85-like protein